MLIPPELLEIVTLFAPMTESQPTLLNEPKIYLGVILDKGLVRGQFQISDNPFTKKFNSDIL